MEAKDWIAVAALIVAFASLAVATVALKRTTGHNATIRQYASATPDIALAGQMNQARQTMTDIALKLAEIAKGKPADKLTEKERQQLLALEPIYTQAVESLHKSYDLACRLYLDGSVDRGPLPQPVRTGRAEVLRGRDGGRQGNAGKHFNALQGIASRVRRVVQQGEISDD